MIHKKEGNISEDKIIGSIALVGLSKNVQRLRRNTHQKWINYTMVRIRHNALSMNATKDPEKEANSNHMRWCAMLYQ